MTPKRRRWAMRLPAVAGLVLALLLAVLALVLAARTSVVERWARRAIVSQLERMTGGHVQLASFRFDLLELRAELHDLTIHGRELEGTPPFFHADFLRVDFRVVSLLSRKIALDEVRLDRPAIHVGLEADGRSNVSAPQPARRPGRPWRERLFELAIRQLRLNDGELLFNDLRIPLVAEGANFRFALDFAATNAGKGLYRGELSWEQMLLAARRYSPFRSDLAAKFTLSPENFELLELRWKLPASEFHLSAALSSFAQPSWAFRFQGILGLEDLRTILRKPNAPHGEVEFSGEGRYSGGKPSLSGRYSARNIALPYRWFHTAGITSRGSYHVEGSQLEAPDFEAQALGGMIRGRVAFNFDGLKFRADTRTRAMSLAQILAATDNPGFPIALVHWNSSVDVDSVTTWIGDFKHVESRGQSFWTPPVQNRGSEIPATGRLNYQYLMDRSAVELQQSEISTPSSRLELNGRLGARDSALEVKLDAADLIPWNDFINRLRGPRAVLKRIAGRAQWYGRVLGRLGQPTFAGHVRAFQAAYGGLYWDELEGDLTYSPDQFRFQRAHARRGRSSAAIKLQLELDDWSFRQDSQWELEANLIRADMLDLQELFETSYPARGLVTGSFRGHGTRSEPGLSGVLELAEVEAWGFQFDRVRGQLALSRDEVRISDAEIRKSAGRITGKFLLHRISQELEFEVAGAGLPIERIERLQSNQLPLAGQLSFQITGSGPLRALTSQGTLRLVDFRVGEEALGSFHGQVHSDGRRVALNLSSAMAAGQLQGELGLTLAGDYPLVGDLTVQGLDLDPFIRTALHLKDLTGHSRVTGHFRLTGALAKPETITVEADVSELLFDYHYLKLENAGPVRTVFRREEVRIEQAHIRGPETDFNISGYARFTAERPVNLNLAGTVNLGLAGGLLPEVQARGVARVNAAIEGTFSNPRITGKVRLENASANYGDFPAGLSRVTGEFVFDHGRLLFENVTAEAGGGTLVLAGMVSYGTESSGVRYDFSMQATKVRIRYPEGMSWLAGGTLRLAGTARAALLSGRIVVDRLLTTPGSDLATLILISLEPVRAPTTPSPYLRNLQFDIEAVSSPEARMEWSGARFESEASLRVRGTWEHPILLGHIHLLSGEMTFRGNHYRLTRGDLNFANPFRLDPVLNVEATTTIRQYEVTLNFTGPASRLTLAYRSDPPLPSSDIIALLALGRTGEESQLRSPTPVQAPELGATTLLSEAISSQLGGRIERLFGVSRFKVDPFLAGTGSEQNASARITIEQQLTRDLTITYVSNVTSTQQQVIQVEYSVSRDISIIALRDQNGTFGLDVKFKKRFK